MNPSLQSGLIRPRSPGLAERWNHRLLIGLFVILWLLVVLRQIRQGALFADSNWPEAALLVAALLVTVSTLARQVSLQSALMAAGLIGLLGGSAHWASYVTGVPFGPLQFPHAYGTTPLQEWFFVPVLIWVVVLLNTRGLARLVLGGASKHPNHGYHLLGFSVLLVVVMAMAIEPFASTGHRYWLWGETRLPVTWQGVPLSCLFAWGAVSVIASFAATPFLIDKHPRPIPPSREPAWIWALLNGLFALGAAVHGLWPATILAGVSGAFAVVVLILARRQPAKRPPDRLALSPS